MCTRRLRDRVPSACFDERAILPGFTLKFHKKSRDGSGKGNALYTRNPADEVQGVIFDIDEIEKDDLDRVEGRGNGYNQITIRVHTANDVIEVFTYVADDSAIDDSLMPYTWYKDIVLSGAREHSLPEDYIHKIESVEAQQDPDKQREAENRKFLST